MVGRQLQRPVGALQRLVGLVEVFLRQPQIDQCIDIGRVQADHGAVGVGRFAVLL